MKKIKVIVVIGTRPEIIRLACVIQALDNNAAIEQVIIHTGQNYDYELNEIFFNDLGIRKPDYFLEASGKNATETIGKILISIDPILEKEAPEAFLVLGDTNSSLCAIPAKKRKIPIFHMEAGNRCFDQRVPEETNRKIVDHISDINLTYSSLARECLLREGLPSDRIIKTGSPIYEVLNKFKGNIETSDILERLNLEKQNFFVVSSHREENINNPKNFSNLLETLNRIAEEYDFPVVVSTHPRTRNMLTSTELKMNGNITFLKPLGFFDYNALQLNSYVVLSDSGTISEESAILNFRALNIRETHERLEAMEEASVMMVGLNPERILQGITALEVQKRNPVRNFREVYDYSMPNVSEKVVRIIISYIDYVNRVVWSKE
ncbi:non-hydrolyzing UDP-N-acetylglucosamine 2-epimerase [Flagellimonas lutimaris]|uniref:non-hydrolyzing UDP-N-acetylglucosamine 2-epimerase n=1 Tax=Flagellimonas lutimaris TaxID=475082 RepID=UPI003F5CC6CE